MISGSAARSLRKLPPPAWSQPRAFAIERTAHDQVALTLRGARQQQVDARPRRRGIRGVERHLLSDDRRELGFEGEKVLFDLRIAGVEADAAVVREPEAAHLVADERCTSPRLNGGGIMNSPTLV